MQIQNYFSFQNQISAWILTVSIVFASQHFLISLVGIFSVHLGNPIKMWILVLDILEPDNSKKVESGHQGIREEW